VSEYTRRIFNYELQRLTCYHINDGHIYGHSMCRRWMRNRGRLSRLVRNPLSALASSWRSFDQLTASPQTRHSGQYLHHEGLCTGLFPRASQCSQGRIRGRAHHGDERNAWTTALSRRASTSQEQHQNRQSTRELRALDRRASYRSTGLRCPGLGTRAYREVCA